MLEIGLEEHTKCRVAYSFGLIIVEKIFDYYGVQFLTVEHDGM